jgi:hypothetical protein
MKFFLGLIVGAAGAWYYRSTQPDLSAAPRFMDHARDTVSASVEAGVQKAAEVIDRTPMPRRAKDVATHAAEAIEDKAEQTPTP